MRRILKSSLSIAALLLLIVSCQTPIDQPDKISPQTKMDSISYIIGYDYGEGIKNQEIDANAMMIYKGLYDALYKEKGIFEDSVQTMLVEEFQKEVEKLEQARFQVMLEKNKAEGKAFLAENLKQEGVVQLPNGLQYKILKMGTGKNFPLATDSVTIHYRGMYIDRTTFDMSYDSGPVGVRLNHVVKGLSDGIQLMKEGSICEFYLPSELGYGDKNFREFIPAGSVIIYSVELFKIHK